MFFRLLTSADFALSLSASTPFWELHNIHLNLPDETSPFNSVATDDSNDNFAELKPLLEQNAMASYYTSEYRLDPHVAFQISCVVQQAIVCNITDTPLGTLPDRLFLSDSRECLFSSTESRHLVNSLSQAFCMTRH